MAAMRSACEDMLRFCGEPARSINAEYLFTVAIAKQIDKLNCYYGDPYRIYLEKKVKEFSRDCLIPVKFGSPMRRASTKFRGRLPPINGTERIDIAVYEDISNNGYMGHQPICAIEVKGFNPRRRLVLKDLKRNIRYFKISGETGGSILQAAIFASLHSWPKTGDLSAEDKKLNDLQQRYTRWLSELGQNPEVTAHISVHSVSKDLNGEVVDECDHQVLNTDTIHHFAGVIVEFRAK